MQAHSATYFVDATQGNDNWPGRQSAPTGNDGPWQSLARVQSAQLLPGDQVMLKCGQVWREPFMVQAFLPDVAKGDKRIVLVDGKPAGGVNRLPREGEIRSNLAVGGKGAATELTPRDLEICEALGPELARRGLVFVGIDVIAGYLTEINVTSPTGIVAIDRFNGTDTAAMIWQAIEARAANAA